MCVPCRKFREHPSTIPVLSTLVIYTGLTPGLVVDCEVKGKSALMKLVLQVDSQKCIRIKLTPDFTAYWIVPYTIRVYWAGPIRWHDETGSYYEIRFRTHLAEAGANGDLDVLINENALL